MKQRLIFLIISLFVFSCKEKKDNTKTQVIQESPTITFPEKAKAMSVYEVNIRQYTPEGTFKAFEKHLPKIKELGTDMLWIMPVQPIGVKNRKGGLGSYYSIQNYTVINPEFGTMDDFKSLVKNAQAMGFTVILDWVPNHTAWDNPWVTEHPEYYAKDSLGNITHEADWTDIALLDHSNPELRASMIAAMKFWVTETGIDGFRCDHAAHEIPMKLWKEARAALDPIKDLFWLAEWDEPKVHPQFHASYNWGLLHLTEEVAKGEKNATDLFDFFKEDLEKYGKEAFRMTITTNHDENSWAGTVFERYGAGHKAFAALIFTAPGFPMIYSGQEVGLNKRLKFFEKDSIDWSDPKGLFPFYQKLVGIKKNNAALWNGAYGGSLQKIEVGNENVFAFLREKDENRVTVLINLTAETQEITIDADKYIGNAKEAFTNQTFNTANGKATLTPWETLIFIK